MKKKNRNNFYLNCVKHIIFKTIKKKKIEMQVRLITINITKIYFARKY